MKRNKQDCIDDASNKQKHQKTNNNAKSKEALDDTSSKTGTVTVHDVDNSAATCTADPDNLGNAWHNKQQQKQQSKETTERNKSNSDNSKMLENNINTPVHRSTVSKKTMFSILENIDLFYLSRIRVMLVVPLMNSSTCYFSFPFILLFFFHGLEWKHEVLFCIGTEIQIRHNWNK
jgi:hypothetical protein